MSKGATLICFMGVDGAGKSTQAKELARSLQRRGILVQHVDNRFEEWAVRPLLKLGKRLFLRRYDGRGSYREYQAGVKKLFDNRLLSFLRSSYILGWQVAHGLFKVRLPLALGRNVVSERYIYDVVTVLTLEHGFTEERVGTVLCWFWRLLPRPNLLFLLDIPEEVAWQRKDDIPSLDYLQAYRRAYLTIAEQEGAKILNGCHSTDELQARILSSALETIDGAGS